VPSYAVRLEVRTDRPLSQAQLDKLDELAAGRHELLAGGKPRGRTLTVSLTMAGADVVGALARSLNVVLDLVPGRVHVAEVTEQRPRPVATPRRVAPTTKSTKSTKSTRAARAARRSR
jgi:hypothetical protein